MSPKILVSSCLVGEKCAYDGRARTSDAVRVLCERVGCVLICPEMAGGLGCPRKAHEITAGDTAADVLKGRARVLSSCGEDHTDNFVRGAGAALREARANRITMAIMKSRSPSCGKGSVYSGRFDPSTQAPALARSLRSGFRTPGR
ncbi:MAG: DUF523 domain-containing protein [Candidatus Omnitrophota bacterium]